MNAIEKAVSPLKTDAVERAEQAAKEMVKKIEESLAAVGWDMDKVAPYPNCYVLLTAGNMPKWCPNTSSTVR